jgi:hypothetical protein
LLYAAVSLAHAALTIPAILLILALLYGAEWLAVVVGWACFFPSVLLYRLGLLGWDGPLEGPLEVMIPLNSLVWPLFVIPLASGVRWVVIRFPTWPRPTD